eukprot:2457744-Rhodomonas_salina.2
MTTQHVERVGDEWCPLLTSVCAEPMHLISVADASVFLTAASFSVPDGRCCRVTWGHGGSRAGDAGGRGAVQGTQGGVSLAPLRAPLPPRQLHHQVHKRPPISICYPIAGYRITQMRRPIASCAALICIEWTPVFTECAGGCAGCLYARAALRRDRSRPSETQMALAIANRALRDTARFASNCGTASSARADPLRMLRSR